MPKTNYNVYGTGAWPLELQDAFVDALSARPEVREAYITASCVVGREEVRYLTFIIDFNDGEKELFEYLSRAIDPYINHKRYELKKAGSALLRRARHTAMPVYIRDDARPGSAGSDVLYSSVGEFPYYAFENWDSEKEMLDAKSDDYYEYFKNDDDDVEYDEIEYDKAVAEHDSALERFETKMRAADYLVPVAPGKKRITVTAADLDELGLSLDDSEDETDETGDMAEVGRSDNSGAAAEYLPVFTCTEELRRLYEQEALFDVMSYREICEEITGGAHLSGFIINPGGNADALTLESVEAVDERFADGENIEKAVGGVGARPVATLAQFRVGMTLKGSEEAYTRLMKKLGIRTLAYPLELVRAISAELEKCPGAREAFLMQRAPGGGMKPYMLLLLGIDGDEDSVFKTAMQAMRHNLPKGEPFSIMKASAALLSEARMLSLPLWSRGARQPAVPSA
jgi:hypothetical protein